MTDKFRKTLTAIALLVAFALGGAAVASAVQGGSESNAAATTTSPGSSRQEGGAPRQRSDETLLTGETGEQVRAAALAEVKGATIERVETDADGNAAYEAHMVKTDGTRVTVYVNRAFEVVGTEEGHGGPMHADEDSAA
jgi:uncharacterized membrane protein YkoI